MPALYAGISTTPSMSHPVPSSGPAVLDLLYATPLGAPAPPVKRGRGRPRKIRPEELLAQHFAAQIPGPPLGQQFPGHVERPPQQSTPVTVMSNASESIISEASVQSSASDSYETSAGNSNHAPPSNIDSVASTEELPLELVVNAEQRTSFGQNHNQPQSTESRTPSVLDFSETRQGNGRSDSVDNVQRDLPQQLTPQTPQQASTPNRMTPSTPGIHEHHDMTPSTPDHSRYDSNQSQASQLTPHSHLNQQQLTPSHHHQDQVHMQAELQHTFPPTPQPSTPGYPGSHGHSSQLPPCPPGLEFDQHFSSQQFNPEMPIKRKRGRPKGSVNRPKVIDHDALKIRIVKVSNDSSRTEYVNNSGQGKNKITNPYF